MPERSADPWDTALAALARRELTRAELRRKLLSHRVDRAAIDDVLDRLAERGYVDDRRVAYNHALFRAGQARRGPLRVRAELVRRGVAPELADEAIASAFPAQDEARQFERAVARHTGRRVGPLSGREREKLARRLIRDGFPQGRVIAWLGDERVDGAASGAGGEDETDDLP